MSLTRPKRIQRAWWLFAALLVLCFSTPARSAPPAIERTLYTIAVGQNEIPEPLASQEPGLAALRYADDDAIKLFFLLRSASREAFLLALPDAETQARVPNATQYALPPSLTVLEQTVDHVYDAMQRDRAAGRQPELVFFFSGHGVRESSGGAALALFDGMLTQKWLYEKLLARLPARYIHLIIDSCHAGAVVRSRDVEATLEPLDQAAVARYVEESTLAKFPHVGAILASTASTQSFEWDTYRSGVFAHELLSGLRGAADVNGDGRIEYSELSAFFSAANLQVGDPRARLEVVVQPPRTNARVPVFEHVNAAGEFKLVGRGEGHWAGAFYVESENGSRLLDVFPERGASLRLWLPSREKLYLVRGDREVVLVGVPGSEVALASLKPRPVPNRSRGALESSLRRGLFGTRFGPAFYLGFTTDRAGLVAVPLQDSDDASRGASGGTHELVVRDADPSSHWRKTVATGLFVGGGSFAVVAGIFTGIAVDAHSDYAEAPYERESEEARSRFNHAQAIAWATGGTAVALAGAGAVLLLWPESKSSTSRPITARVGVNPTGIVVHGKF